MQKLVEAAHGRQRARRSVRLPRPRRVRCPRKPRIARRSTPPHVHAADTVVGAEELDEGVEVAAVGDERVRRDVALLLEVEQKILDVDVLRHAAIALARRGVRGAGLERVLALPALDVGERALSEELALLAACRARASRDRRAARSSRSSAGSASDPPRAVAIQRAEHRGAPAESPARAPASMRARLIPASNARSRVLSV